MTDEPIKLSKDTSLQLCVVCSKPVSDGHDHDNSIREILDWQVHLLMRESILQDVSKTKKVNITEDMLNTAKAEAEAKLNAYILGEVMELVGYDTQTMHDDNGISDFANMDIDIAITDLINWVNNGGKIDIHEKNRLKNRIIERVHGSRQEHGANQLRQELRNKANKKFGGK